MARILLVDDDDACAAALTNVLADAGHQVIRIGHLGELRHLRHDSAARLFKPQLCLVELVRLQTQDNGFQIAAALAARLARGQRILGADTDGCRVVLLSDRDVCADAAWASSRGIHARVSRRSGADALLRQLEVVLNDGCCSAEDVPCDHGADESAARAGPPRAGETCHPVSMLRQEMLGTLDTCLMAAAHVNRQQPESVSQWMSHARDAFKRVQTLQRFLGEYAVVSEGTETDDAGRYLATLMTVRQQLAERGSMTSAGAEELGRLLSAAVKANADGGMPVKLREALRLSLALTSLSDSAYRPLTRAALLSTTWQLATELYSPHPRSPETLSKLQRSLLPAVTELRVADEPPLCVVVASPSTALLLDELLVLQNPRVLTARIARHLAALRLQPQPPVAVIVLLGALYDSLQAGLTSCPTSCRQALHCLRLLFRQPSACLSELLEGLRACPARVSDLPDLNARDQPILATELSLLPRPHQWFTLLAAHNPDLDLLLLDLQRELSLLAHQARDLAVWGIESLAQALLAVYQYLADVPEPLSDTGARQQLRRAHQRLCQMLDRAALWQGSGRAGELIESLFELVMAGRVPDAETVSSAGHVGECPPPLQQPWSRLSRINVKLLTLTSSPEIYRVRQALVVELLQLQRQLIRGQLAYQKSM